MAINRAGLKVTQSILWWVTYHPDTFIQEKWHAQRTAHGGNTNFTVVSHARNISLERSGLIFRQFPGPSRTGSSSLLGVLFGIAQGYQLIVVAGAPLDHHDYSTFRDGWKAKKNHLAGRVRSLSGWTKTFLEGLNHGA